MLSAKPWKADAIIRLLLSVMVCVYAGSLLMSAVHYASAGGKANPKLFYALAVGRPGLPGGDPGFDRQTLADGGPLRGG